MRGIGSDNIIMDIQWQTSQQLTELLGAAVPVLGAEVPGLGVVGLNVGWEVGYIEMKDEQIYHMRGIGSDNIIMDIQWQTSQQLTELVGAAVGLDVGWEVGYIEMKDDKYIIWEVLVRII